MSSYGNSKLEKLIEKRRTLDWKYIVGEVLLIFVGINLAIWFNDWNSSKNSQLQKDAAIDKIKEEIRYNAQQLDSAHIANQFVIGAFTEFQEIYNDLTTELIATPLQIRSVSIEYPDFFQIEDSVALGDGRYRYSGGTFIRLELPELNKIAWEAARSINITGMFDYECLYRLERMYNLQRKVLAEMDKAADTLQKRDLDQLIHVLEFLEQLTPQLQEDYKRVLESIDGCR